MIVTHLPWLLSAITIWMTLLAGNKNDNAWLVGIAAQALWLWWIVADLDKNQGLLPMNIALWVAYLRNHLKWNGV